MESLGGVQSRGAWKAESGGRSKQMIRCWRARRKRGSAAGAASDDGTAVREFPDAQDRLPDGCAGALRSSLNSGTEVALLRHTLARDAVPALLPVNRSAHDRAS